MFSQVCSWGIGKARLTPEVKFLRQFLWLLFGAKHTHTHCPKWHHYDRRWGIVGRPYGCIGYIIHSCVRMNEQRELMGVEKSAFFFSNSSELLNSSEPINRLAFQSSVWLLEATSNMVFFIPSQMTAQLDDEQH